MSLDYTTYVAALVNLAVESTPPSDAFTAILPSIIDDAEQRIYREIDLLSTIVRDSSANVTANSRTFTLPQAQGRFVVVEGINIITPVGTTPSTGGARNALTSASREYIDFTWPSEAAADATTIPTYFGMVTDQIVIFGSPPGDAFNVEVVGTIRPAPISASNPTTFLSLYLPDLFLAASVVFLAAWQKNFGSSSDNPQMAVSWEAHYQALFKSANLEETRKKFASVSWTSKSPSSAAVPQRG
jgi:hypothetical protein